MVRRRLTIVARSASAQAPVSRAPVSTAPVSRGPEPRALGPLFLEVRRKLGIIEDFTPEVTRAAEAAAAAWRAPELDLTRVPFVTIDPPGSRDLDQAMAIRRRPGSDGGHEVDYAIADVPAFVVPQGLVDTEARRRGQTLYAPDRRIPLHPAVLSERAASLLPGQQRPAFVWRFTLDGQGVVLGVEVHRALVRSRARLDYEQVQGLLDAEGPATAEETSAASGSTCGAEGRTSADTGMVPLDAGALALLRDLAPLLREVGERRIDQERIRGGASLPLPNQEVEEVEGAYVLRLRAASTAEDYNAQISLMTGMAAADLMLAGGIGLLRTMPGPDPEALAAFRRRASSFGVDWPADEPYGEMLRRLDRRRPGDLAALHAAVSLFRGAAYSSFEGPAPALHTHGAIAAPYAHVTAPLRRLVDRFALVTAHALAHRDQVPAWVRDSLPLLPEVMRASDRTASQLDRGCVDVVEAAVLAHRVGETFAGVAVSPGLVQIADPPVLAACSGDPAVGVAVSARLVEADPVQGRVRFALVGQGSAPPGDH